MEGSNELRLLIIAMNRINRETLEEIFGELPVTMEDAQNKIQSRIIELVEQHPLWPVLPESIQPYPAACLLAEFSPERAASVSGLWRYAGYGSTGISMEGEQRDAPAKFNRRLKRATQLAAIDLMDTPYGDVYRKAEDDYKQRGWPELRVSRAALRIMVKLFLKHLWIAGRTKYNLEVDDQCREEMDKYGWCL